MPPGCHYCLRHDALERLIAVLRRIVGLDRERGAWSVLRACVRWATQWVLGRPRAGRPSRSSFDWDGRRVAYLHHRYNYTWLNERAVETALALEVLREHAGQNILEIGNVMSHYVPVDHLVVDKYEHATGVVNADVGDLILEERFGLILAVSTLEHVGLDEDTRDPDKAGRAIARLKDLLGPGGLLWVTLPVGYNADLDDQLRAGEPGFTRLRALVREEARNRWREVPVEQVWLAWLRPVALHGARCGRGGVRRARLSFEVPLGCANRVRRSTAPRLDAASARCFASARR